MIEVTVRRSNDHERSAVEPPACRSPGISARTDAQPGRQSSDNVRRIWLQQAYLRNSSASRCCKRTVRPVTMVRLNIANAVQRYVTV